MLASWAFAHCPTAVGSAGWVSPINKPVVPTRENEAGEERRNR